jgi:hypothetical protein
MATGSKIADFIEGAMEGEHNLASNTIMIALSNTAPASETSNPTATGNGILANVTQLNAGAYTNYSDSLTVDRTLESVTSNESGGTYTFDAADFTITASGGDMSTWQYLYIYNDTNANDDLIGVWDHGSGITLASTEQASVSFNASGIFTVA